MEPKVFSIGDKMITIISHPELIDEIDVHEVLRIDYANIMGELLTFPVLLNQLGELLVEIEDFNRKKEMGIENSKEDLNKLRANLEYTAYISLRDGADNKEPIKAPTIPQIKAWIDNSEAFRVALELHRNLGVEASEVKRDMGYVRNLYWSAKAKMDVITKMTDKLSPNEFAGEIIDGKINGIMIKVNEKLIKDPI